MLLLGLASSCFAACADRHLGVDDTVDFADQRDVDAEVDEERPAEPDDNDRDGDEDAAVTERVEPGAADGGSMMPADAGSGRDDDGGLETPVSWCTVASETEQLGTATEPYVFDPNDGPLTSIVDWRSPAFIHIAGLTSGQRYAIVMLGHYVQLSVFESDAQFGMVASCERYDHGNPGYPPVCEVTATDAPVPVTLESGIARAGFQLHVIPVLAAEGTAAQPVVLQWEGEPLDVVAPTSPHSFYRLQGLTAGATYVLTASRRDGPARQEDDFRITVFADPQYTQLVDHANTDLRPQAIAAPVQGSLFVTLHTPLLGIEGQLEVALAEHSSEGATNPVEVEKSALPFEGEVGWAHVSDGSEHIEPNTGTATSRYDLTGFTPGSYVVKVQGPEGAYVQVGTDDNVHGPEYTPCSVRLREGLATCIADVDSSVIHVEVTNYGGSGGPILLDVEEATFAPQGEPGAQLEVPVSELSGFEPELQHWQSGHYAITGLMVGEAYRFEHQVYSEGVFYLGLYRDAERTQQLCPFHYYFTHAGCDFIAESTAMYFSVNVHDGPIDRGFRFTAAIKSPRDRAEGTLEEPVRIDCASGAFKARVGVKSTSYYEVVGVSPGEDYLIEASGSERVALRVFPDGSSRGDGDGCRWAGYEDATARCAVTAQSTSLFVEVAADALDVPIDVRISQVTAPSDGTADAPFTVTSGSTHAGHVALVKSSYYALTGLEVGKVHVVDVVPVQQSVQLHFVPEHGILTPTWASPGRPNAFAIMPTATSELLEVAPRLGIGGPTDVRIAVFESLNQSEGLVAPVALVAGEAAHQGAADSLRSSFYALTGLTPSEEHTLVVESSGSFAIELLDADIEAGCRWAGGDDIVTCSFVPSGNVAQLEVKAYEPHGVAYTITLE